jgi:hypothetical protein
MIRSVLARLGCCLALVAVPATAATITGEEIYGPYSWNEFVARAGAGPFPVVARGAPDGLDPAQYAREMLPSVQAARPYGAVTFALADSQLSDGYTLRVSLVYCRGSQPLTAAVGVASASTPSDPAVQQLFREALPILFPPRNRLLEGGAQPLQ